MRRSSVTVEDPEVDHSRRHHARGPVPGVMVVEQGLGVPWSRPARSPVRKLQRSMTWSDSAREVRRGVGEQRVGTARDEPGQSVGQDHSSGSKTGVASSFIILSGGIHVANISTTGTGPGLIIDTTRKDAAPITHNFCRLEVVSSIKSGEIFRAVQTVQRMGRFSNSHTCWACQRRLRQQIQLNLARVQSCYAVG